MNRQSEIPFAARRAGRDDGSVWRAIIWRLIPLFAATVVVLLLVCKIRL